MRYRTFRRFEDLFAHLARPGTLEGVRTISFDVFDTLVFRRCSPEAVQHGVARALAEFAGRPAGEATGVLRMRDACYAEEASLNRSRGLDGDAHLTAINARWATKLLPDERSRWPDLAAFATDEKLRYEELACYANPAMPAALHALRQRGFRLIYVSDMYLGEELVSRLLARCGLRRFFDAGYVSGDHALTKRTGRLFREVLAREATDAASMMHIGDNARADGRRAAGLGIAACVVTERHAAASRHASDYALARSYPEWHAVAASRFAASGREDEPAGTAIGRDVLGPVLASYTHGLAEHCARVGADKVFFLSRDDMLLRDLYEDWRAAFGFHLPPSAHLCLSRVATVSASMRGFGARELALAANADRVVTARKLLKPLRLPDEAVAAYASAWGLCGQDAAIVDFEPHAFAETRVDDALRERGREVGETARRELLEHLSRAGFFQAGKAVLAGAGWDGHGQIQENLEIALGDLPHPALHGYFPGTDATDAALKSVHIIGNVCRAPHGADVSYRDGEPAFQSGQDPGRHAGCADDPRISLLQAGIRDFVAGYARYAEMSGMPSVPAYARSMLARMALMPRAAERQWLGDIRSVANPGGAALAAGARTSAGPAARRAPMTLMELVALHASQGAANAMSIVSRKRRVPSDLLPIGPWARHALSARLSRVRGVAAIRRLAAVLVSRARGTP